MHDYGIYTVDALVEGEGIEHGGIAQLFILNAPGWKILGLELLAHGDVFEQDVNDFTLTKMG